jgi:hypothetical protein
LLAERDDACTRVEDDDVIARANLHARGIAAKANSVLSRRGITPSHTPKSHHEWFSHLRLRCKFHPYYHRREIFFKESFLREVGKYFTDRY